MDITGWQENGINAQRAHLSRAELTARLAQAVPEDGVLEPMSGLRLGRASAPTAVARSVYVPALCVIAQGRKELWLGDERYHYDPDHYLITTATLPVASQITEASPEQPFLTVMLQLDPMVVGSVMVEAGYPAPRDQSSVRAIAVSPLDVELLDAIVRLVRLVNASTDTRVLTPLVMREIVYRLLAGSQGERLRQIAALGGQKHRIVRVIEQLRTTFDQPLRIEDLAQDLGMSVSGFHHHFKAVTAMSPLEFQKRLRLQEARRLMLGEGCDATSAGFRVGYNDVSHFNRDYKRLFGEPPMRDIERLRGSGRLNSSP
ncbi:MAG: AraC family transcriptional regulator [Thermomicrobiales bacterium]|nr:AraC family transcriptional regulator [Thermomicrobiales bacterium]